jgi:hypothetical protein
MKASDRPDYGLDVWRTLVAANAALAHLQTGVRPNVAKCGDCLYHGIGGNDGGPLKHCPLKDRFNSSEDIACPQIERARP